MRADRMRLESAGALRVGGWLAVLGGVGYVGGLLLHGDLPDQTTQATLAHIAGRPEWRALKLALVAFLLCWVGALAALVHSLPPGRSRLLAQWATGTAIVGVSVVAVEYAIIGHALKDVADTWHAGSRRAAMLDVAAVLVRVSAGLFHTFIAWLMGLAFVLAGAAVASSRTYPPWLGWVPVVTGSGSLLAGVTRFLGLDLVPYPVLYGAFVIPSALWLAAMGVAMWRAARAPSQTSSWAAPLERP